MKYFITTIIFSSFFVLGSFAQMGFSLESDKDLAEFYSKKELKDLTELVAFVDGMVVEKTGGQQIEAAYHLYFEGAKKKVNAGKLSTPLSEKEKYAFLEDMDQNVFNSIWVFEREFNMISYRDTILRNFSGIKMLRLKYDGRYSEYLLKVGESDAYYKSFVDLLRMVGNLSAAKAYQYPNIHDRFDYSLVKDRLFAAIFILNTEENIHIKLDNYFKRE